MYEKGELRECLPTGTDTSNSNDFPRVCTSVPVRNSSTSRHGLRIAPHAPPGRSIWIDDAQRSWGRSHRQAHRSGEISRFASPQSVNRWRWRTAEIVVWDGNNDGADPHDLPFDVDCYDVFTLCQQRNSAENCGRVLETTQEAYTIARMTKFDKLPNSM